MIKKLLLTFLLFTISFLSFGQVTKTFNTDGIFTVPAGVTTLTVQAWGAGGSGGGSTTGNSGNAKGGSGGGGGAYSIASLTIAPGAPLPVKVAGTTPATAAGSNGSDGGFSTITGFETTIKAAGGKAGLVKSNTTVDTPLGGAGGSATNPDSYGTSTSGSAGFHGDYGFGISSGYGGNGANSTNTGGGAIGTQGSTSNGNDGIQPGGGGGGARTSETATARAGGAGGAGRIIISYTSCPTYSLTSVTAVKCAGSSTPLVTLNSSTTGLPVGTYTVTYNTTNPTNNAKTATMTVTTAGTGNFTTTDLTTAASSTITITNLASGTTTNATTNGNLCGNTITSNNTATLQTPPSPQSGYLAYVAPACFNSPITINLTGTIVGAVVRWEKRLNPSTTWIPIANTTTSFTETPTTAGTWEYRVMVGDINCGTVYTAALQVEIRPTLTVTLNSANAAVCRNNVSTSLTYSATTGAPNGYVLDFNSVAEAAGFGDQSGAFVAGSGTIAVNVPYSAAVGTYNATVRVFIYSTACTSINYPVTITVSSQITSVSIAPTATQNFCTSGSQLTVAESGSTITSREWGKRSVSGGTITPISGATSTTYTPTSASLGVGTWYVVCTSSNGGCLVTSNEVLVNVGNMVGNASSTPSLCVGTAISPSISHTTINATGINTGGITGLPTGVTASWNANTITISGTPSAAGTFNYSIPLTGCTNAVNATGTIRVNPILTPSVSISASPSGTVCQGSMITFTATVTNGGAAPTYKWYKNSTEITNQTGNIFQVNDLENGDKVKIVITSNASPCLSATNTATSNEIQPNITMTDRGRTQGGGEICQGTTIPLLKLVNFYGPGNTPYTESSKVLYWEYSDGNNTWIQIPGTAGQIQYQPSEILTANRSYRAQAQTPGCPRLFAAIETTVIVKPLPTVTFTAQANATECLQTNVTYTTQTSQFNYVWTIPGTLNQDYKIISGGIGSTNNTVTLQWLTAGSKTVTVNYKNSFSSNNGVPNNNGCYATTSASSTTNVNPTPVAPVIVSKVAPTCTVPTGSINLSGLPSTGVLRSLLGNSTTATYAITGTTMTISGLSPGTYKFAIDNPCGPAVYSSDINISGNTWNGTTWSGGNAGPTSNDNLVFEADYTINTDIAICSCTVTNNAKITVKSGKTMTVTNGVHVVSGTLTFEDSAALLQESTDPSINSGNIEYIRKTTPIRQLDYVYWSTPVKGQTLEGVSQNLTTYDKYYAYNGSGSGWSAVSKSTVMVAGKGYIIRGPESWTNTARQVFTATFKGTPINGNVILNEGFVGGKNYLLGNPYPSALDADKLITDNPALKGTLYFWTHNTPLLINGVSKYKVDDYASYNLTGGVGAIGVGEKAGTGNPTDNGTTNINVPSGEIAAGQSFMASFKDAGTITFTNAMRLGGADNRQFFKPGKTSKTTANEKHRVWLNLTNTEGAFKQMLVGYIEGATNDYEGRYDGLTVNGNKYMDFYSVNNTDKLTIQGRALPFTNADIVPLGYSSTIAGDFTIAIDHADGIFENQPIYLEDKTSGKVHDLRTGNYTFTTEIGTFTDRFALRYTNKTLGTGDFENIENGLLVSVKDKTIKITNSKETIKGVTVFEITGKVLYTKTKVNSNDLQISNLQSGNQVLLVKVTLDNDYITTKKIILK